MRQKADDRQAQSIGRRNCRRNLALRHNSHDLTASGNAFRWFGLRQKTILPMSALGQKQSFVLWFGPGKAPGI
jgi:hypothetical protein